MNELLHCGESVCEVLIVDRYKFILKGNSLHQTTQNNTKAIGT